METVQLPITIPPIKGAASPVFTTGRKIVDYQIKDLKKRNPPKDRNRITQYGDIVVALYWALNGPVPYRFIDSLGKQRSHDAGCMGHLYNCSPRFLDFDIDAKGRITGVIPKPEMIAKHNSAAKFNLEKYFSNIGKNSSLSDSIKTDNSREKEIKTSDYLSVGEIYTRENLKQKFSISDATINTGIFRPSGHSSIWIFVTKEKTKDRTQYLDDLNDDVLHWQGQTSGRKDNLIITHETNALEILLFYRKKIYEHAGAGFRFEGRFRYINHHGAQPASFTLRKVPSLVQNLETKIQGIFDPANIDDARRKTLTSIIRRSGQKKFRESLLRAYDGRCAISGCDVFEALEAAHIYPYNGYYTNFVTNGLLLRADLHTLFDLGLVSIEPDGMTVVLVQSLQKSDYGIYFKQPISLPTSIEEQPSKEALKWHFKQFALD
jgi:putative restriction endonuclease